MSLKRRFEYQYNRIYSSVQCMDFPAWMNSALFRVMFTAVVVVMGVGYIWKTSNLSTSGYVMRDLEDQVAVLESDIQKSEVDIALNSSLSSIEGRLKKSDMVPVERFSFASPPDAFVAKK